MKNKLAMERATTRQGLCGHICWDLILRQEASLRLDLQRVKPLTTMSGGKHQGFNIVALWGPVIPALRTLTLVLQLATSAQWNPTPPRSSPGRLALNEGAEVARKLAHGRNLFISSCFFCGSETDIAIDMILQTKESQPQLHLQQQLGPGAVVRCLLLYGLVQEDSLIFFSHRVL